MRARGPACILQNPDRPGCRIFEVMSVQIKRIYTPPAAGDGCRVLVDRLWPRGISKEKARLDFWLKEVAPSTTLRRWFAHDPAKWAEFRKKYLQELKDQPGALQLLREQVRKGPVTLLYAARDEVHNEAEVLRELLSKG